MAFAFRRLTNLSPLFSRSSLPKYARHTYRRANLGASYFCSKAAPNVATQWLQREANSSCVSLSNRTHSCGAITLKNLGCTVDVSGWVQHTRLGGQFLVLRDAYGTVQVVIGQEGERRPFPLESVLRVKGVVRRRPPGQENNEMSTGDVEIEASHIELLNNCSKTLPFQIHEHHAVKESLRLEHRYLDLRHKSLQSSLRLRSSLLLNMRRFLCEGLGFVDVETPTLFRRTPGGAREFLVPVREPRSAAYSLPQSPQQFKQLLMAGGIDRYMQVARCYRDETSKPDRQPEFTQLDLEMSFVTQDHVMTLVEQLLLNCWPVNRNAQHEKYGLNISSHKETQCTDSMESLEQNYQTSIEHLKFLPHIPPITIPFPRLSHAEAMRLYGSDKPDTRYGSCLHEITKFLRESPLEIVGKATSVQAVVFKKASDVGSRTLQELKLKTAGVMANCQFVSVFKVKNDGSLSGGFDKILGSDAKMNLLKDELRLESGDVVGIAAGGIEAAQLTAGKLRTELFQLLCSDPPRQINFLWVDDFPLFCRKEGGEGWESCHHPFTAPHPDDAAVLYSDPGKVRGQHYDLVLNGCEVGGGSIRIHNADTQRYVIENILNEDCTSLEHLLRALGSGCPPHGGIALGLDRLLAVLCGANSIRDVIAFPKSGEGKCLMSQAPSLMSESELDYYNLTAKR